MWIYSQGLATIYYKEDVTSEPQKVSAGYSGQDTGLNNPEFQCELFGPLPRGDYTIGAPEVGPSDYSLRLTPDADNDMCNPTRSHFLIHGDRDENPPRNEMVASHGCIILPRAIRERIWNSGDTKLRVVDYGA